MMQHRLRTAWTLILVVYVVAGLLAWPSAGFGQVAAGVTPIDDWARVQRQGTLLVGTAPDDPPFTFLNDSFALDGYDIAVMKAVGKKLGVEVKFEKVVFPSILDALELGQYDAAIAAIAVTDGRREEVDFTIPYYIGSEGVLAAIPSSGSAPAAGIRSVADLAGHKIGAQAGSLYAGWLRASLIDPGTLPEENLILYNTIDQAIAALQKGEIDLLVLDELDANEYARMGGFAVVGQGLSRQHFAVAVRKGSTLAPAIDNALLELQQDGTIAKLAADHLNVDQQNLQPLPTPTPLPIPTPPPCTYYARYAADLTYDDAAGAPAVQPGQQINKRWRIVNTGTCAWDPTFRIAYYGGDRLGGQGMEIGRSVAPGESYDVAVNLLAPSTPGTYRSQWGMVDSGGQVFGQPVWATLTVPGAPPAPPVPPPAPPAPPAPTAPPVPAPAPPSINDFHASHRKVAVGLCVKLRWDVSGKVTEVKIKRDGSDWKSGLGTSGSKKDCPSSDGKHTYELKVYGPGGKATASEEVKFKYMPLTGGAGEMPGGD